MTDYKIRSRLENYLDGDDKALSNDAFSLKQEIIIKSLSCCTITQTPF